LAKTLTVSIEELNTMIESSDPVDDPPEEDEYDPVLTVPWNHRGTVNAVVMLSGGDGVKRRTFVGLSGTALTAPAHQWLVHEPEPLVSGLSGRRIPAGLAHRLTGSPAWSPKYARWTTLPAVGAY
jgi:hypothetical protein